MPRRFSRRAALAVFGGVAATAAAVTAVALNADAAPDPPAGPDEFRLTILHTNDLHGHVLPFAYTEPGRSPDEKPSVGGAARRATLVRRLRGQIKNPVVLVDAGDTFTRGPLTNAYEGIADIEAMNAVGYEMAAVGNNEFKAKDAAEQNDAAGAQTALLRAVRRSRFPWLCANATDEKGAPLAGVQPFVVRQYGSVRVGFLGLTAPRSAFYPQTKGWRIGDPIAAAKAYIPRARAECDVLIAVTHIGVELDKKLAAETTGIDAIVGGDSHTFLYKAEEVKNADGSRTVPIVQDGEFGVNLGRFDLRFTRATATANGANGAVGTASTAGTWRLATFGYKLLPVGPGLKEAPDVAAAVRPYTEPLFEVVATRASSEIGATPAERARQTTRLLVEALRRGTGADLAMNPAGSGMFETLRSPAIRRYDILAAMPFKNRAVIANLSGARIRELLDARTDSIVSTGGPNPATLDPARTYKVALVDFNAVGDYKLAPADLTETGRDIRDLLIEDLKNPRARPGAR